MRGSFFSVSEQDHKDAEEKVRKREKMERKAHAVEKAATTALAYLENHLALGLV